MTDNKHDNCSIGEKHLCIKTKMDCGAGCGGCFVHLKGIIDVKKCICFDQKKFSFEKKYPFAVMIIARKKVWYDDCLKHHERLEESV